MPKQVKPLKKSQIPNLELGTHSVGHVQGLEFRKRSEQSRQWVFRAKCKVCSKPHMNKIGPYPKIQLEDAIANAMKMRLLNDQGTCLKTNERQFADQLVKQKEQQLTFSDAFNEFWPDIKMELRDRKAEQWKNTIEFYVIRRIGNRAVKDITIKDIYSVLMQGGNAANGEEIECLWQDRAKTASDIRGRIERILGKAIAYHSLPIPNAAALPNGLKELLPKQNRIVQHHKSLEWQDAKVFWESIKDLNYQSARVLKVLLFTGKRVSEVTRMSWNELDLDRCLWVIPWEHLLKKGNQNDHREPLADQTLKILKHQPADSNFVFPNQKGAPLSDTVIRKVHRGHWKPYKIDTHGFRATIKTFFYDNDQLGFSREHVEMMLTHEQGALDQAYQRGDAYRRRSEMMQVWADFVTGKVDV